MSTLPRDVQRRFGRQIRLSDIGESGQAKLCAAEVSLGSSRGFARTIEERYVRAAGMRVVERAPHAAESEERLAPLALRHEAAQEVAEGALHALAAIRAALGVRS